MGSEGGGYRGQRRRGILLVHFNGAVVVLSFEERGVVRSGRGSRSCICIGEYLGTMRWWCVDTAATVGGRYQAVHFQRTAAAAAAGGGGGGEYQREHFFRGGTPFPSLL